MEDNATRLKGLRNDYKKTFESEEGKHVLKDLEQVCMFRMSTFNKDALTMAFSEGLRAVYLHITTIKDMDIETLEKLKKEGTDA